MKRWWGRLAGMSLAWWVIVSAVGGVTTGFFLGEYTTVLNPVGSVYVMLLQSVVYPYIICSLLHGLGKLSPRTAGKLAKASWPFYLAAWGLVYGTMLVLDTAIPAAPSPYFLDAAAASAGREGFLNILIPANFFSDIATNQVPAVVVFSILFGVALQKAKEKDSFLEILDTVRQASLTIWNWVVKLAPLAVFSMLAVTAGTVDPSQADSLALYLGLFLGGTLFLAFVVLPMAISAFTPASYSRVLRELRNGFVLSAVTTLSVAALPFILESANKLAEESGVDPARSDRIASTSVAVSYPLAQLGNFFVFLFILFAIYFFHSPVSVANRTLLIPMTLLSCVGSPSSTVNAVEFLGSWLALPPAAGVLYVETMTITRYGMVLLSVAGFGFITFLGTLNYFGKLRFYPKRAVTCLVILGLFLVLFPLAVKQMATGQATGPKTPFRLLELDSGTLKNARATVHRSWETVPARQNDKTGIRKVTETGVLRVGYSPELAPFSYFNEKGDLVGFDVAFAYSLAQGLGVELELVPASLPDMIIELEQGRYDILMSAIAMSGKRMRTAKYSNGYYTNPLVLVVRREDSGDFMDLEDLRKREDLTLAAPRNSVLWNWTRRLFPKARLIAVEGFDEIAKNREIDAMLWAREQAVAWSEAHPGFIAQRPKGMEGFLVYGWLAPSESQDLLQFANHWLVLKKADDFYDRQKKIWFEQEPERPAKRRWSILKDVLRW